MSASLGASSISPYAKINDVVVDDLSKKMKFSKDTIHFALKEPVNNQIQVAYRLMIDNQLIEKNMSIQNDALIASLRNTVRSIPIPSSHSLYLTHVCSTFRRNHHPPFKLLQTAFPHQHYTPQQRTNQKQKRQEAQGLDGTTGSDQGVTHSRLCKKSIVRSPERLWYDYHPHHPFCIYTHSSSSWYG